MAVVCRHSCGEVCLAIWAVAGEAAAGAAAVLEEVAVLVAALAEVLVEVLAEAVILVAEVRAVVGKAAKSWLRR